MKHLLRPYTRMGMGMGCALLLGAGVAMSAPAGLAQATQLTQVMAQDPSPLLGHAGSSSQGYLGVDLADVDQEKAQALKLKDVRGAVITLIDHDAPAGKAQLKVNDVVLKLNGQAVEGAEQLRRMLREIPAGRKVALEFSRDGSVQTAEVELADRRVIEHNAWNNLGKGGDVFAQSSAMGILAGAGGDAPLPGGFHMPFFGSTLNVGALVEPLTSQMAEYLGVQSGVMVKQVAHKSEAAAAGLKAFDVILKVGTEPIVNLAGWDRAIRANEGKPVQVTVLRDRKQQTLTLQVDSKHHGELKWEEVFPGESGPEVALLEPDAMMLLGAESEAQAQAMREQAEKLKSEIERGMNSQQAEQMRKQAEELRDRLKGEEFKIDQKQMDEMKRQMEEFSKNFKPQDLKIDPKAMEELKRQMEEFGKDFQPEGWLATPN